MVGWGGVKSRRQTMGKGSQRILQKHVDPYLSRLPLGTVTVELGRRESSDETSVYLLDCCY